MTYDALDDFAGPGDWDLGAAMLAAHVLSALTGVAFGAEVAA